MLKEYFVLITNDYFGVFKISAVCYPEEFYNNLHLVKAVSHSDLQKYLIDNLGRNILINKNFNSNFSVGLLFSRHPS